MSYTKEENVEKKLYYEVVSMIDKNKQHFKEIEDFLRKKICLKLNEKDNLLNQCNNVIYK